MQANVTSIVPSDFVYWDIAKDGNLNGPQAPGTLIAGTAAGEMQRGFWAFECRAACTQITAGAAISPLVRVALISAVTTRVYARQNANDAQSVLVKGILEVTNPNDDRLLVTVDVTSVAVGGLDRITAQVFCTYLGAR